MSLRYETVFEVEREVDLEGRQTCFDYRKSYEQTRSHFRRDRVLIKNNSMPTAGSAAENGTSFGANTEIEIRFAKLITEINGLERQSNLASS